MTTVSHGIGPHAIEYADPNSPYEIAVRLVEQYTKTSRHDWEPKLKHPRNLLVLDVAKYIAGKTVTPRPPAPSRRPKATPIEPRAQIIQDQGVTRKRRTPDHVFE